MSKAAPTSFRERVSGKWQLPGLVLAIALLVGAIARLRSVQVQYPIEAYLAQVEARVADGYYTSALDYAGRLEKRTDLSRIHRASLSLHKARARYLRALREQRTTPEEAEAVQTDYATAHAGGAPRTVGDLMQIGRSYVWQDHPNEALARFEAAVELAEPPALDIRREVIEFKLATLKQPAAAVIPLLDAFVDDCGSDTAGMRWAAATKIELLASEGLSAEAVEWLESLRASLEASAEGHAFRYLEALVQHRIGNSDEAESLLRELRNRLSPRDDLYAQTGWLLGRVVLSDGKPQRPEESLSFFTEVIQSAPGTPYAIASRLGSAEACAALGRFAESLAQFREVAEVVLKRRQGASSPLLSADAVRSAVTATGERLRREGAVEAAVPFYELARSLVAPAEDEHLAHCLEILGGLRGELARLLRERAGAAALGADERAKLEADARYLLVEAAENFAQLAELNQLQDEQSVEAVWRAAHLFSEGRAPRREIALLERFIADRPGHERIPQALLRLGQARRAEGLYPEAIEAFQDNLRRFPRTPDAGSGLIPLARCYLAMGPGYVAMAVDTLNVILRDSPMFTPEAPEFRDALFLMGDTHSAEGKPEDCIAVLEEALERYPDDPRSFRSKFLLADAYRQSAAALKRESEGPEAASERPRMRSEATARFGRAASLFGELVEGLALAPDAVKPDQSLDEEIVKQARLYQADCLFELGRLSDAVALYETAAFIFRDDASALSAYVQIINCRLSLGQATEARTALRRARYLLQIMPDRAFEGPYAGQSRREWERYMDWLERSDLF